MFTALGGLMAERVTDVRDVRDRIVAELTGQGEPGVPSPDVPSVLLADDLAPADTAGLDPTRVIGLATRLGGTTSHTAIIARQLGLPCVVAVGRAGRRPGRGDRPPRRRAGHRDRRPGPGGGAGPGRRRAGRRRGAGRATPARPPRGTGTPSRCWPTCRTAPARGPPSRRTPRGSGCSAPSCPSSGTREEPSVEEQAAGYAAVFEAFAGRKVVLRTLDAGSDKPLAFATLPDEANPALGVRGLRIARLDPGLLERQLDAVAEAARGDRLHARG